jgi:hypothetical protein
VAPLALPLALVPLRRELASFQSDNVSHDTGKTEKHAHEGSHIDRTIFVLPSFKTKPCSFSVFLVANGYSLAALVMRGPICSCLFPSLCRSNAPQEKHRNSSDGLMLASRLVCAKRAQDIFDRPDFPVLLMMHSCYFLFEVYHSCPFQTMGGPRSSCAGARVSVRLASIGDGSATHPLS